jgi:histidine decarboxylase
MRGYVEFKGYQTSTVYDPQSQNFVARREEMPGFRSEDSLASSGPSPAALSLSPVFDRIRERMRAAHETHLGYPYNLSFEPGVPANLGSYLINNLGDPYVGSHYASQVCDLEREAISWLMRLWQCDNPDDFWGSIGASGTEGNLWGIYLGREKLPDAVLLHSEDAHYSIPKAARLQRIEAVPVASNAAGELELEAFARALAALKGRPVIVALTCGTTMKGAHDDIAGVIERLDEAGIPRERRYIHVDGALNAMVIPFLAGAPASISPSFRLAIDSVSTSGHKMIGTPMPCGALICRKEHSERVATAIAYLRSNDTTLMGSRNGHAVLAIWSRVLGHGYEGYHADATVCAARAQRLASNLRDSGAPAMCNPHSLTVVFPQPPECVVKTYQLACHKGDAHAIVMPNVTDTLLNRFVAEYVQWRETSPPSPRVRSTPPADRRENTQKASKRLPSGEVRAREQGRHHIAMLADQN